MCSSDLPTPVHVASWVDDLIFIMATPVHDTCSGFDGGCPTCAEYRDRALAVQAMWEDKARRLKIPLSGKGHSVSQHGVYTGVAIDTVRGRYLMLPDKLAAMAKARDDLWASSQSTPRLIARVRGKAIHYGCAIPFVAVAAASLSQLMHDRECGSGPVQVPAVRDEGLIVDFDWDRLVSVSGRAKAALDFMRQAMESYSAESLQTANPSGHTCPARSMAQIGRAHV